MSKKTTEPKDNPYHIFYENYLDTNACTECTGLIPTGTKNREEWNAYRQIYDFTAKPPESPE